VTPNQALQTDVPAALSRVWAAAERRR